MIKFESITMRKKIICLFLGCFGILLIGIILILHDIYRKQIYQELLQRDAYEDKLIIQSLDNLSQNVESCCNNMIMELNVSLGGKKELSPASDEDMQVKKAKVLAVLENNLLLFPDISEITVAYNNGEVYTKEKNKSFTVTNDNFSIIEAFRNTNVDTRGKWYQHTQNERSVYYLKVLNEIDTNTQKGYVLIRLEENTVYLNYKGQKKDELSEIFIFDREGILMSTNQREMLNRADDKARPEELKMESDKIYQGIKENTKKFAVSEYQTKQGWKVLSALNIDIGMRGLRIITRNIILLSIALVIIFMSIILLILKKIMNPIVVLSQHMAKTGANPLCKIQEVNTKDEIGNLVSSFNQMVDMNETMVMQLKMKEKEKRRLELSLLQMQIKPHFLYNTLDTAFCLNGMERHKEASRVIKQLAGYYRLVLNNGNEWISLAEELSAVEKYLDIQSVRYSELVDYTVSVDEELYRFQIPKMTLQPLVENAIYHGIKPMEEKGHILIIGELCEDDVTISIIDNGIGMSGKLFDEILSGKRKGTDKESFGLKSVAERLRLFYGEDARIELENLPIGTGITLSISLRRDGQI